MKTVRNLGFLFSGIILAIILVINSAGHRERAIAQVQLSQAGNPTGTMSSMEWDVDRLGLDYRNFDLEAADPTLCQNACANDPNCQAWTYVRPNTIQGPHPRCWLKHTIPSPRASSCCVSGTRISRDSSRPVDSDGRRLHSSGTWLEQRERLTIQAGQGIHLVLRNGDVLPVDVVVQDTSFTAGDLQRTVVLPPLGEADIVLSKFGSEPMTWDLLISSAQGRETGVFIVNWELYSTWVPGDPQNR